jgi:murein L,D-transpeptidase YcbB/YkuD
LHIHAQAIAAVLAAALAAGAARAEDGAPALVAALALAQASAPACGTEAAALASTRARLRGVQLPASGKLIVVNTAAQALTAYQDGLPALEMRVVVGRPDRQTPDLQTEVSFVRLNPTWTVPQSIMREDGWRELAADGAFLEENGFDAYGADGRRMAPGAGTAARLVQRPGESNPLGVMKVGLRNANGVFLHGTNEPEAFGAEDPALSHGCVRVEDPFGLAGWILGNGSDAVRRMQEGGDTLDRHSPEPVRVVVGYFTAWPDAGGAVRFYPDIYGRDAATSGCALPGRN